MNSKPHESNALFRRLVAEVLVIVAGVLIALAIDEWWTSVEESDLADIYLNQVIADLITTEERFAEIELRGTARNEAALSLLVIFEENKEPDLKRVQELLFSMRGFNNPVPVLGTIETLISTGDLRLIPDTHVRVKITEFLSYVRDYWLTPLYQNENNYRLLFTRIQILAAQYGISPRGANHPSRDPETVNVPGFLANDEAYAMLAEIVRMQTYFRGYRDSMIRETTELRHVLGESDRPH